MDELGIYTEILTFKNCLVMGSLINNVNKSDVKMWKKAESYLKSDKL